MILYSLISGVLLTLSSLPVFFIVCLVGSTVWIIGIFLMIAYAVLSVYFLSNFFMIFVCCEIEKSSFGDAVQRISHLLKGKTWSTCGITSINLYIQYIISTILLIPWYVVQYITLTHTIEAGEAYSPSGFLTIFNLFFVVLYFLFYILLYAIPMLSIGFQYFSLVETKESEGLMRNIEAFGTETEIDADEHY